MPKNENTSWSTDPYFQNCRLCLKSDKQLKEPLKITAPEKALTKNFASAVRKNHFLLGRHYTHLLLTEMGHPQKNIFKKNSGSPLWEKGIKGSISHCKGYIAICLSDEVTIRAIGIDIENSTRKVQQPILKKISHPQENFASISTLKHSAKIDEKEVLSIFCLKEAILKCFGSLGEKIEFQDIVIASLNPPLVSVPRFKLKNQKAYLLQTNNFILASLILR